MINIGIGIPLGLKGSSAAAAPSVFAGAEVAYSLRIPPNGTYSGPLIRVRRSSDNAEQDISAAATLDAYGNKWLDEAALLAFVGAGDGFVVTWYDQSANARNATQATTTIQPRIVVSGAIYTINSKPSMTFGSSRRLRRSTTLSAFTSAVFGIVFQSTTTTGSQNVFTVLRNTSVGYFDNNNIGAFGFRVFTTAGDTSVSLSTNTSPHVNSSAWAGGSVNLRIDGTASSSNSLAGNATIDDIYIGANNVGTDIFLGKLSEFVFSTVSTERDNLESSAGEAFGITIA